MREKYFTAHSVARILCSLPPDLLKEALDEKEKMCPTEMGGLGYYLEIVLAILDAIPIERWGRWGRLVAVLISACLSILGILDLLGYRTGLPRIAVDERTLEKQLAAPGLIKFSSLVDPRSK